MPGALLGGLRIGGLLDALEGISRHRLLDRLIRGRAWIGVVAFALIGIVAMQLWIVKLGVGIGRALEHEALLQRENATLSIEDTRLSAGERVEALAAARGMVVATPGSVRFDASHGVLDARLAAAALARSGQVHPTPLGTSSAESATGSEGAAASATGASEGASAGSGAAQGSGREAGAGSTGSGSGTVGSGEAASAASAGSEGAGAAAGTGSAGAGAGAGSGSESSGAALGASTGSSGAEGAATSQAATGSAGGSAVGGEGTGTSAGAGTIGASGGTEQSAAGG
jgi:hypothetical protein